MAHLHHSVATLRIGGDLLNPEEISRILGCVPTLGYVKGQIVPSKVRAIVRKTGAWQLAAADQKPANLDAQVKELFSRVNNDLGVWAALSGTYKVDLFCGFFMSGIDEGLEISAQTLKVLGDRGIKLGVCIYAPAEEDGNAPA
jgi:hypothetical protein